VPDIPAEAVRLAVAARANALHDRPDPMVLSDETLTRMMLEAASPAMAGAAAGMEGAHAFTRESLTNALTRLELRVQFTGPIAGKINAESMADAIIEALEENR
jgi:hypothetical protein